VRILEGAKAKAEVTKLAGRLNRLAEAESVAGKIVKEVRQKGDLALRRFAEQWDGLGDRQAIRVSRHEMKSACDSLPCTRRDDLRAALKLAAHNIRKFAERQMPKPWMRKKSGVATGQIIRPIAAVGCYVPGGRYPLPSTLLMTVIPAQVAGVERICVVSPQPRIETVAAAAMLGVKEFYRVGGAQAVAALAYGTKTIRRVNKIVGPGNLYVTAAKKLVAFDCGIDFLAGPTEALVVSHSGRAEFIASDLVAQSEHDPEATVVFITASRALARAVAIETERLSRGNTLACQALRKHGSILVAKSKTEAMTWANEIACEHLTVEAGDLHSVRDAGSVFVGDYSAQAAGDYVAGPNHVLPTAGTARCRGGLTVMDFLKVITVQQLAKKGIRRLAPAGIRLAEAEGLSAHAESLRVRLKPSKPVRARSSRA
jgi:histidinol dehydrogenase